MEFEFSLSYPLGLRNNGFVFEYKMTKFCCEFRFCHNMHILKLVKFPITVNDTPNKRSTTFLVVYNCISIRTVSLTKFFINVTYYGILYSSDILFKGTNCLILF